MNVTVTYNDTTETQKKQLVENLFVNIAKAKEIKNFEYVEYSNNTNTITIHTTA